MPAPVPSVFEDPVGVAQAFIQVNSCSYDGDLVIASSNVGAANFCLMAIIFISGFALFSSLLGMFSQNAKLRPSRMVFVLMALVAILSIATAFIGFRAVNAVAPVTAPA